MSERVSCKDSTKKRVEQTIVKIGGWSGVRCYRYELHEDYIEAGLHSTHRSGKCPYCGRRSSHVDSRYERTVDDVPEICNPMLCHDDGFSCCFPLHYHLSE